MNNENAILILALLLINKGEPLNNSYKLMRILEWKFKILNSKEILDAIKEKNYAEYDLLNGVHHYKLKSSGRELIKEKYDAALKSLLQHHPNERESIVNLFNSFTL